LPCCNIVGVGLQWSNINKFSSIDDNFTMLHTLIMLIIDIILYTIITWYFDALLPGDFGTPQPFYFPFTVFFIFYSILGTVAYKFTHIYFLLNFLRLEFCTFCTKFQAIIMFMSTVSNNGIACSVAYAYSVLSRLNVYRYRCTKLSSDF